MKNFFRFIITSACIFAGIINASQGQGIGKAPYSYFGIGELISPNFASTQSTGGAGVAYANGLTINNLNPGLLARIRYTTYEIGLHGQGKAIQEGIKAQRDFSLNLNYFALGLPVGKKWTLAANFMPYSYLDYEIRQYRFIPNTNTYAFYSYKGTGGLNKASISNGFQVGKNLGIGLETSYIFGVLDKESTSQLPLDGGTDYQITLLERTNQGGFRLKTGVSYRKKLNKDWYLNMGGTYELGSTLNATRNLVFETKYAGQALGLNPADTVANSVKGSLSLPSAYRVGITLESPYKLAVSLDYAVSKWGDSFKNLAGTNGGLQNSQSVHFGVEYTPDFNAIKGYGKLMTYRLGAYQTQTPYIINGTKINDLGFTGGFSFPLGQNRLSSANIGMAIGKRGVAQGAIQENYVKINVGFSLLDQWFIKYRID